MSEFQDISIVEVRNEVLIVGSTAKCTVQRDEDGYFKGIPVALADGISQNNTSYDSTSIKTQLMSDKSPLRKNLIAGKLYGELDHPSQYGFDTSTPEGKFQLLDRMGQIRMSNVSHHIRSVTMDDPGTDRSSIIRADILPFGPYKSTAEDSLSTPTVNTSFSLRAITERIKSVPSNMMHIPASVDKFFVNYLVSFDLVPAGGFAIADKLHSNSLESFNCMSPYHMSLDGIGECASTVRLENFTNTEINEILKTNNVFKMKRVTATIEDSSGRLKDIYGKRALHSLLSESLHY